MSIQFAFEQFSELSCKNFFFQDTCMQSMTVMVKKVATEKSIEEPSVTVAIEDENQQTA